MDNLPDKLRELTQNRYFAVAAVVFLAFLTALFFAIALYQSTDPVTGEPVDKAYVPGGKSGGPSSGYGSGSDSASPEEQSPLEKLVSILTGKSSQKTSESAEDGSKVPSTVIPVVSDTEILTERIKKDAVPLPKVHINKYVLKTELPPKPEQLYIYSMKNNYTEDELDTFAQQLGLLPLKSDEIIIEKSGNLRQIYDIRNKNFLSFDTSNGTFIYVSENGYDTGLGGQTSAAAKQFLVEIGRDDQCITQTATYITKNDKGITHVEFHCDWDTFGAPILGTLGALNLPDSTPISGVSVVNQSESDVSDDKIVFSSDGSTTKRKNDFNTIRVSVQNGTGKIMSASSNIPVVAHIETVNEQRIMTPQESFSLLEKNQTLISLTSPQGTGHVDFKSVFSNNEALADSADVTDFVLAYNVLPGESRDVWCPEYITRSNGDLTTGPSAVFIQTLPAINDARCKKPQVLGTTTLAQIPDAQPTETHTGSDKTYGTDYGSFTFEPSSSETTVETDCPPELQFTHSVKLKDNVYLVWFYQSSASSKNSSQGRMWYVAYTSPETYSLETGNGVGASNFNANVRLEYLKFRSDTAFKTCKKEDPEKCTIDLPNQIVACKYLTTGSPSLYGYSPKQTHYSVSVHPYGGVGYLNPIFTDAENQTWNVSLNNGMHIFSNGQSMDRLYYEFRKYALLQKVREFGAPTKGITVKKSEIDTEFSRLAQSLNLNQKETEDLVNEAQRETNAYLSPYISISLLPAEFIEIYLPVDIKPAPATFSRFIFYLKPAFIKGIQDSSTNLLLRPAERSGSYFIETGVLSDN